MPDLVMVADSRLTIEASVLEVTPAPDLGPFAVREQRKVYQLKVDGLGFLESITVRLGDQVVERIEYIADAGDDE